MIILEPNVYKTIGQGIKYACDAVKPTIGPLGKNIAYDPKIDVPYVVNSGREIVKRINFTENKPIMVGVDTVKQAMETAFWKSGDGSVATAILVQKMWDEGMRNIAAGTDSMAIMRGIRKAGEVADKAIKDQADKVDDSNIRGLAKCAAAGRDDIADIVSEVYENIGPNGYITVEDSQMAETHISYFKGVKWANGFNGYWEEESITLEDVSVLLVNRILAQFEDITPLLTEAREKGKAVLIIARDFKQDVSNALHYVRDNAGVNVLGVIAPGHGEVRDKNMANFGVMFGATVFDEMMSDIKGITLSDCGHVDKAVVNKVQTVLQGIPNPDDPTVVARRNELYADLEHIKDENERYRIEQMLTPLAGDTAEILVGGVMEMEMFERKYLCENAIHNTYSAIKHGMLPGGGKGLMLAYDAVAKYADTLNRDEKIGALILQEALCAPAFQIAENAGFDGKSTVEKLLASGEKYQGFDVLTGKYVDLKEAGILDSVDVVTTSLDTAVSSISTALSVAACVITEDIDEDL